MKNDPIDKVDAILEQRVDFETRSIFLNGDIDDKMARKFQAALKVLERVDPNPLGLGPVKGQVPGITIYLNSAGGEEGAGFAMYDAIRNCERSVTIIGTGNVMSMATLIFQAGDARMLTPTARLLIHNGTFGGFGDTTQQNHIIDYAKEMKAVSKVYAGLIAERSGLPVKKVLDWCRGDKFFSAVEAVEYNLADFIIPYKKKEYYR
jgi:ATP-dependent Clp protease protease subunit